MLRAKVGRLQVVRIDQKRFALLAFSYDCGATKRTGAWTFEIFILGVLARVVAVVASRMSCSPAVAREVTGKDLPAVPMDEASQIKLKDLIVDKLKPVYKLIDEYIKRLEEKEKPVHSLRASGTSFDHSTAEHSKKMTKVAKRYATPDSECESVALTRRRRRVKKEDKLEGEPGSVERKKLVDALAFEIRRSQDRQEYHKHSKRAARVVDGEVEIGEPGDALWRTILYNHENHATGANKSLRAIFAGFARLVSPDKKGGAVSAAGARRGLATRRKNGFKAAPPSAEARAYRKKKKAAKYALQ